MKWMPLACLLLSSKRVTAFAPIQTKNLVRTMSTTLSAKPFSVVVQAEIKPDRMDEFLEMIEANAVASRKEPGCLRFGTYLLQSSDCWDEALCAFTPHFILTITRIHRRASSAGRSQQVHLLRNVREPSSCRLSQDTASLSKVGHL